ncbi:MAG TPA: hypothetical protein PK753_13610 [Ignavibacteria bacterium]|nr:hypothetical protein [Ignavibacteria bacterium]
MKIKLSASIFVLYVSMLVLSSAVNAQDITLQKLSISSNYSRGLIIEDKINTAAENKTMPLLNTQDLSAKYFIENRFQAAEDNMQVKKKQKSVGLGVLLSAIIPGAGELYGGNYLKAGIFFGIEVLAWATFAYFTGKGNTKQDEYQAYADENWDVRTYARWLKNEGFSESSGINPDEPNRDILREQIMVCERANFSHTMPEYGSQQYYELIGKYQNFQAGWKNLTHVPTKAAGPYNYQTYRDPVFTNYAADRQKANDFFDYAKVGPITAIVNHILSAADAAWVISTYNNKIKLETGFRMQNRVSPYTYQIKQFPTFNVAVSF